MIRQKLFSSTKTQSGSPEGLDLFSSEMQWQPSYPAVGLTSTQDSSTGTIHCSSLLVIKGI